MIKQQHSCYQKFKLLQAKHKNKTGTRTCDHGGQKHFSLGTRTRHLQWSKPVHLTIRMCTTVSWTLEIKRIIFQPGTGTRNLQIRSLSRYLRVWRRLGVRKSSHNDDVSLGQVCVDTFAPVVCHIAFASSLKKKCNGSSVHPNCPHCPQCHGPHLL